MANSNPRQEIVNRLQRLFALPPAQSADEPPEHRVQFLKERHLEDRQVHAVTFLDRGGQAVYFICYLEQNEEGMWNFRGGGGGNVEQDIQRAKLMHGQAWVNLHGGGWPMHFYAGGFVIKAEQEVARVSLITSNGLRLEDRVEQNIVLFLTKDPVETPLQAELYTNDGQIVNSHNVF